MSASGRSGLILDTVVGRISPRGESRADAERLTVVALAAGASDAEEFGS